METLHSLISWISRILILLSILGACNNEKDYHAINLTRSNFLVELENSFVKNTVIEYARENHLDTSNAIITVNVKTTSYDTSVYINHLISKDFKRYPTYYSFVDKYLVFLYTDVDRFIRNASIRDEVDGVIYQKNIMLDTAAMINDTPTLKISKCENKVLREFETDEIELPCFLQIIEEDGELKLVKKE